MTDAVEQVLREILALDDQFELRDETPLLGHIPEFDSLAVVTILTTLEEDHDFDFDEDELSADVFETLGSLKQFLNTSN